VGVLIAVVVIVVLLALLGFGLAVLIVKQYEQGVLFRLIFAEYLAGRGLFAIAEALTRDRIPSRPSTIGSPGGGINTPRLTANPDSSQHGAAADRAPPALPPDN
jgi:hypothetical protein